MKGKTSHLKFRGKLICLLFKINAPNESRLQCTDRPGIHLFQNEDPLCPWLWQSSP
jgi:hypothetical protein